MHALAFAVLIGTAAVDLPTVDRSHRDAGRLLLLCAKHGVPRNVIKSVFGAANTVYTGPWDWRTNPEPFFHLYQWDRYGVWVEWTDGKAIPKTGFGRLMRCHGGEGPGF